MLILTWVLESDAQRTCKIIRNRYSRTPRTRDKEENVLSYYPNSLLKIYYPVGSMAVLRTLKDKTGKFGRILGELVWEEYNY